MDRPTSRRSLIPLLLLALPALPGAGCGRGDAPQPELAGYWEPERSAPLLAATMRLRLAPDVEHLDGPERAAVEKLLAVGELFQRLYERQSHAEALEAHARLLALHESSDGSERTSNLLDLYRLFKGPVATTLENAREPFLPVAPEAAGRNVYPAGMTREELDEFLAANPAKRARILDVRSVVRRAEPEQLAADLATLDTHPALDTLHPALRPRLESLAAEPAAAAFYSVPYSVAYAAELLAAHDLLHEAADAVEAIDGQFAGYLRLRARDLLTNDYEGGDAAWVSGEFGRLNAQIGSYETYDDELYGVKSFFGLSLLVPRRSGERAARTGTGRITGDRRQPAVRRIEARARRDPGRSLRRRRRLRAVARHEHGDDPAKRKRARAQVRTYDPDPREYPAPPRNLR